MKARDEREGWKRGMEERDVEYLSSGRPHKRQEKLKALRSSEPSTNLK